MAAAGYLFLTQPPGDYSVPLGKNPSISTASPRGSVRAKWVTGKKLNSEKEPDA
jgi:hypothetical protein